MSLFFTGLGRASSKEGRDAMLISDMDVSRLIVYVQQVKEEKLRDKSKKSKTGNESVHQKYGMNWPQFHKQKGSAPSSTSVPAPRNKGNRAQSSSVAPPERASLEELFLVLAEGENRLYAITSLQEQENSPDIVTSIIKVFTFGV
ncbi:uncharacterized protein LOC107030206 [Solanum pennellii]|uniref:Uncharacterized protein LOC107030206 n=1 Tax=Solanum pennellii TaxID=28526 RepID=A0ABM1HL30_SOLPN|nr:uncharacterized protein LOC107030206 [Solanum pennellii]